MSLVSYSPSSAYAATPQSNSFIGRYVHRQIRPDVEDSFFTITPEFHLRPDALAYRLYGNPKYAWVFCSRNIGLIRDLIWDFTEGKEIIIPSATHIKATFG